MQEQSEPGRGPAPIVVTSSPTEHQGDTLAPVGSDLTTNPVWHLSSVEALMHRHVPSADALKWLYVRPSGVQ